MLKWSYPFLYRAYAIIILALGPRSRFSYRVLNDSEVRAYFLTWYSSENMQGLLNYQEAKRHLFIHENVVRHESSIRIVSDRIRSLGLIRLRVRRVVSGSHVW